MMKGHWDLKINMGTWWGLWLIAFALETNVFLIVRQVISYHIVLISFVLYKLL
uniref:Uncharacterized protein n=1 Tax=Arundo donax TaxID=35708 RepID=A0A0A9DCT6_ARUDO